MKKTNNITATIFVLFIMMCLVGCSVMFENKACGSISIATPSVEAMRTAQGLTKEEWKSFGIESFNIYVLGKNEKLYDEKINVTPGKRIELTNIPVGECTVICEAFALDEQNGYKEFKYGGEDTRKIEAGKTTSFIITLKPAVFVSFTSPYQNIPVIRDAWEGATITMPEPSIFTHEDPDGNLRTFVPEGYEFEYWKRIDDETEKEYYAGDRFTLEDKNIKPSFIAVLKKVGPTQIGDIAYSDMTTSRFVLDGKNPIGLVIAVENGKATKIMSLKEGNNKWCPQGTSVDLSITSSDDGYASRDFYQNISENKTQYEALGFANSYREGNLEWYIPAKDELLEICGKRSELNTILYGVRDAAIIKNDHYWTSTYAGSSKMYYVDMGTNNSGTTPYMDNKKYVRCFAKFAEN